MVLVLPLNLSDNPFKSPLKWWGPAQTSSPGYWNVYSGSRSCNNFTEKHTSVFECVRICRLYPFCKQELSRSCGPAQLEPYSQPSDLCFHLWPASDLIQFLQVQTDKQQVKKKEIKKPPGRLRFCYLRARSRQSVQAAAAAEGCNQQVQRQVCFLLAHSANPVRYSEYHKDLNSR